MSQSYIMYAARDRETGELFKINGGVGNSPTLRESQSSIKHCLSGGEKKWESVRVEIRVIEP